MTKSEQVVLDAKHNVWLQRNLNSPLLGMNNTGHLDSAVGVQGLGDMTAVVKRDAMGRPITPVKKNESAGGMKI